MGRRRKPRRHPRSQPVDPVKHAEFQRRYMATDRPSIRAICLELGIYEKRGFAWASDIRADISLALRDEGIDERSQARTLAKLQRKTKGRNQLEVAKEINRLLDLYPASKERAPSVPPVNLFVNFDVLQPGDKDDATHKVIEHRGPPTEHPGNAGVRPSA